METEKGLFGTMVGTVVQMSFHAIAARLFISQQQELEQIFREHYYLTYRTAYGVTGSPEDAEDVVQTIFLRLLRREFPPNIKRNPKASIRPQLQ